MLCFKTVGERQRLGEALREVAGSLPNTYMIYHQVSCHPKPANILTGDDALRRLLGSSASKRMSPPAGMEVSRLQEKERKTWLRGEVCPLDVKRVDVAPEGTEPVDVVEISPEVRRAMSNRGAKVIHPDGERRFGKAASVRTKTRP